MTIPKKILFKTPVPKRNTEEYGEYVREMLGISTINLPQNLGDDYGKYIAIYNKKKYNEAGYSSGRYIDYRNQIYVDYYVRRLEELIDKKRWKPYIDKLKKLDVSKNDFLSQLLPSLDNIYVQYVKTKRGKKRYSPTSEELDESYDIFENELKIALDLFN